MKKYISGFLVFVMVFGMFSFNPGRASAATIFSDGFGTANSSDTSFNESPTWDEGGNNGDDAEKRDNGSGNDSASPNGDRFAIMFGEEGYICRTIDTTGFTNVKLSYNWRGDADAENNDDGIVEYKANGESCTSNAFTLLKNHDLSVDNAWSTQSAFDLPDSLDNTTFKLRFRVDSSSDDEHFRVDGITITGDALPTTGSLTVTKTTIGENGTFSMTGTGSIGAFNITTTSNTGSQTFNNLTPGSYTVTEAAQSNWTETSNTCTSVAVTAGNTATCEIVNTYVPPITTGNIEITKYVCEAGTTVVRSQNGVGMTVPETCTPQSGKTFGYVHGEQTDANGPYPELSASLTPAGVTDMNGVLTISNLESSGRYLVVETNGDNQKIPDGDILGLYCTGDGDNSDNNDNQELTFVPANGTVKCVAYNKATVVVPPICEATDVVQTIVSDTTTQAGDMAASPITPHPAWLASIPGATWIYDTVLNELGSSATGNKTFTKNFTVVGTPLDSTLEIAADNMYTVSINGNPLTTGTSATDLDNFGAADSWTIPASMLVTGSNTLSVTVTNPSVNPNNESEVFGDPNPAGLLFKITVHQNECVTPEDPEPEPVYVKVHLYKYLKNVESTNQVSNESTIAPFPMTATWDASNIGAGTGNYILGNYHGQGALKYAADTSAMLAPVTSYTSFERTNVSEEGVANVLPIDAQCVANQYRLVGYKSGTTLGAAQGASISTTAPVFTNFSTDQHVIVVNEDCNDVLEDDNNNENEGPTTGTLIVRKLVINDEGGVKGAADFSFTINGEGSTQFTDSPDEDTMTGENQITVNPGTYTITENLADGYYKFSEDGCANVSIVAGETKTCTFVNYDYVIPTPGSGSNGLGGGEPQVLGASTSTPGEEKKEEGQVLGANVCTTIYLNDYLFFGKKNNPEQVKLLQIFLNEELGLNLTVDGKYGKTTRDAVKAFQVKYFSDVLTPWKPFGLKDENGTGNVYKTTKRKINLIKCADLNLPIPQLP